MRGAKLLLGFALLVAATPPAAAPAGELRKQRAPDAEIRILSVSPQRFGRDDRVKLRYEAIGLPRPLEALGPAVLLNGSDCEIVEVDERSVTFRAPLEVSLDVPMGPELRLEVAGRRSPAFHAFTLVPRAPGIASFGPREVERGAKLTVVLAMRPDPLGGEVALALGGVTLHSIPPDEKRTSFEVVVPDDVPTGDQPLTAVQAGSAGVVHAGTVRVKRRTPWDVISVALAAIIAAASGSGFVALRWRHRAKLPPAPDAPRAAVPELAVVATAAAEGSTAAEATSVAAAPPPPPPEPPPELRDAVSAGACVLYVGEDLAMAAKAPSWRAVLEHAIGKLPADADPSRIRQAVAAGLWDAATDLVRTAAGEEALRESLVASLPAERAGDTRETRASRAISRIPFAGLIVDGWAEWLVETLSRLGWEVLGPGARDAFLVSQRAPNRYVIQLRGDARRGPVLFTSADLRRALYENELLAKFLAFTAASQSVLFAGASLEAVERILQVRPSEGPTSSPHFALVPWSPDLPVHEDRFRGRYGVRLLAYRSEDELLRFLEALDRATPAVEAVPHRPAGKTLDHVRLTDIGPFETLELPLGPGWNVLLGNNGCGKSTILRAIALGLCGDDPKGAELAAPLLRAGKDKARVELRSGRESYVTEIFRHSPGVRVKSQVSPVQAGKWVVVGFPPLRGVSLQRPSGPSNDVVPNPEVGDLLPLLSGAIDGRMDRVAQWIVNTDARASAGDAAAKAMLDSFFDILAALTPGLEARFHSVDKRTFQVMVRTGDGVIPLERISQGTSSVFGWVGTLLRRMHDIYPDAPHPERQPAIVLVDEIDAHMHPAWQRTLVPVLRAKFPATQAVASTHSPLIVGALEAKEVFAVRRESESASPVVEQLDASFEGWRADQILTSPAFDLATSVAKQPRAMDEYAALLRKPQRTPGEQRRFEELEQQIEDEVPSYPETPHAREALRLIEQTLAKRIEESPVRDVILREARRFIAEVGTADARPPAERAARAAPKRERS